MVSYRWTSILISSDTPLPINTFSSARLCDPEALVATIRARKRLPSLVDFLHGLRELFIFVFPLQPSGVDLAKFLIHKLGSVAKF